MLHLRTARVAMVALTAIGMFWTTTTHASPVDSSMTSVYGNNPPTDPGNPTVPGHPNTTFDPRPDIEVKYLSGVTHDGIYTWNYQVKNISVVQADWVEIAQKIRRFQPGLQTEWEDTIVGTPGKMAPGEVKYFTVSCGPKPGHPPCDWLDVKAQVGKDPFNSVDRNLKNNWISIYKLSNAY